MEEPPAWPENLESFPRSRGSHEWGAEWSLVSLQVDSGKKSFLIAHTTPNQSPSILFLPPQIPPIQARQSSNRTRRAGGEIRRHLWTARATNRAPGRRRANLQARGSRHRCGERERGTQRGRL
jgi:hypothetical protein